MNRYSNVIRGTILSLSGGIAWGLSAVCAQYLFIHCQTNATWLTSIRMIASGILLLIGLLIRYRTNYLLQIFKQKKDVVQLLTFAIVGLMLCQYTYFLTVLYTNAGTATTLQYTCPILIMIYSSIKQRKFPGLINIGTILLVVFGIFLLVNHGNIGEMAISSKGLVFGLLSAVTVAIYTIIPERLIKKYGSLLVTGYGMLFGGLALGGIGQIWKIPTSFNGKEFLILLVIIFIGTLFAFTAFLQGVADIGPVKSILLASVEPISATVISIFWLNTPIVGIDLIGCGCVLAAVFIYILHDNYSTN